MSATTHPLGEAPGPIVDALPLIGGPVIQYVSPAILRRHPDNPRLIKDERFEALRESIRAEPRNMMARPLTVTQDGETVCGNMRLEAVIADGWDWVPCWVEYFDPDSEDDQARLRAWMLRDNQEFGEWVPDQLSEIMYAISQSSIPTSLTGFDDDTVKRILLDVAGPGIPGVDEDNIEASDDEPDSQRGIIYPLGNHKLMCGDSLDARQVARLVDGETISMIFTSPPYADQRTYGGDQDLTPERLSRFLDVWAPHVDGPICVNLGIVRDQHRITRYWDTYLDAAERAGLELFSWNVWDRKMAWSIGQQVAEFALQHEWIFVFDTKPRKLNRTVPNKSSGEKGGGRQRQRDGSSKIGANKRTAMGIRRVNAFRQLGTVFTSNPEHSATGHPAAFPVVLPLEYMRACTDQGDVVADPFGGGGTTLVAAEQCERRCLAMEIEPKYVDVARERYARVVMKG